MVALTRSFRLGEKCGVSTMDNDDRHGYRHFPRLTADEITNSVDMNVQTVLDDKPTEEAAKIEASEIQPHPFADMFPMMKGEDFTVLVTSIKEDGLEEPIVTFEEKILDGRNRYAACTEAEVDPEFDEYEGTDPLGFVLRKNLHRRHLTASQRAIVASKMANLKNGQRADEVSGTSIDVAAKALNVGRASVDRAKAVLANGDDELIEAVESGEVSVSAAAKKISTPSEPTGTPLIEAEEECRRLLKLWDEAGEEGRALFLKAIGATT